MSVTTLCAQITCVAQVWVVHGDFLPEYGMKREEKELNSGKT